MPELTGPLRVSQTARSARTQIRSTTPARSVLPNLTPTRSNSGYAERALELMKATGSPIPSGSQNFPPASLAPSTSTPYARFPSAAPFRPALPNLTPQKPHVKGISASKRRPIILSYVWKLLRRYNISSKDIVLDLLENTSPEMIDRRNAFLRDATAFEDVISNLSRLDRGRFRATQADQALSTVKQKVAAEMDRLKHVWSLPLAQVTPEYIEGFDMKVYRNEAMTHAPTVWAVLQACAETSRAREENIKKDPDVVVTIIMTQLAKQRSENANHYGARFGMFAWGCGVSRACFDALAGARLLPSFDSVQLMATALAKTMRGRAAAAIIGRAFGCSADNLNVSTTKHAEQFVGARPKQENWTARNTILLKNAPLSAIQAEPFYKRLPTAPRIDAPDLCPSPETGQRIQRQFIATILDILLSSEEFRKNWRYGHIASLRKQIFPHLDVRRPTVHTKTEQYPMSVAEIDESTTAGNQKNLEDIAKELELDPKDIVALLIPIFGDQMTNALLEAGIDQRIGDLNPYLSGMAFPPIPGFFHVEMNLLYLILLTYRGSPADDWSLAQSIESLQLNRLNNQRPEFYLVRRLVVETYKGNILACWETVAGTSVADLAKSNPGDPKLIELATEIARRFLGVRDDTALPKDKNDHVMRAALLFNRDAALYYEVMLATKVGDFGRIEDLLPSLITTFRGGGSPKYANHLLRLYQNLKYSWTPEFANVIRDNMFVNTTGRADGYMAVDFNQEHQIRLIKKLLLSRGLHADTDALKTIGPCILQLSALTKAVRLQVGGKHSGSTHSAPDISRDAKTIAQLCKLRKIFEFEAGRATVKPFKNTQRRGLELMMSTSLPAFLEQQSLHMADETPGIDEVTEDGEDEVGDGTGDGEEDEDDVMDRIMEELGDDPGSGDMEYDGDDNWDED